jgi:hypothetical protein
MKKIFSPDYSQPWPPTAFFENHDSLIRLHSSLLDDSAEKRLEELERKMQNLEADAAFAKMRNR